MSGRGDFRKDRKTSQFLFGFPRYQALLRALMGGIGKTAMVLPVSFLVSLGLGLTSLGMIFFLRDAFESSAAAIGALFAVWNVAYFTACIVLRPLSRLILPRYSMLIATILMGGAMAAIITIRTLWATFLFYGIYGLSTAFFFPPLMSWLSAGIEGQALNKVMGKFNLSWSLGGIVSPFIAGFLLRRNTVYPVYGSLALFILSSVIILTASLFILRIKNDVHLEKDIDSPDGPIKKGTMFRFPSWGGLFFFYLALGILTSIFPLHAKENLGISEVTVGLLFALRASASAGGFLLLSKTDAWHFNRAFLAGSQGLVLVLLVLMMFVSSLPLLMLLMLFWGLATAANYSAALFHGAAGATERLKRMAMHEAILTAGSMAGSMTGGVLYQRSSMFTTFGTAAGLQAAIILFTVIFFSAKRHEYPVP